MGTNIDLDVRYVFVLNKMMKKALFLRLLVKRHLNRCITLHYKTKLKASLKKLWYLPSRIVFSRCEEKLSKLLFFEGFEIPKMAAEVLFETSEWSEAAIFRIETPEKKQIFRG